MAITKFWIAYDSDQLDLLLTILNDATKKTHRPEVAQLRDHTRDGWKGGS